VRLELFEDVEAIREVKAAFTLPDFENPVRLEYD
jgi:hypothetical protein